jgi:hypothetical protein
MRNFLARDESHIRDICGNLTVAEVGWFTNHYCGIDGSYWQVMGSKS